jgi:D-ribose pyranase
MHLRRRWRGVPTLYEPHVVFKKRVPHAIGLIRTADTVIYANLIIESG